MISVCMATYNGEKYVRQQIESILIQLGTEDELIISDDKSTDSTVEIISNYNDSRIKLIELNRNKKGLQTIQLVTTNFEHALKQAKGDFIFMSDQDDVWTKDKVRVSLDYLVNKGYDYIVSDCYVTDSNFNVIANTRFDGSVTLNRWKALFAPTPYQGSCAAFRRSVLEKALPFPSGLQSHDRWIGFIASFKFKYKIIPEKLLLYRRHDSNTSTATEKSNSSKLYKITTRLQYISQLFKRLCFNK